MEEVRITTPDGFNLMMHRILGPVPCCKAEGTTAAAARRLLGRGNDDSKGSGARCRRCGNHRPRPRKNKPKPVVLVSHGLFDSSSTYVNGPTEISLGYMLADAGYDVWLSNTRGNRYSRSHRDLDTDDARFWGWVPLFHCFLSFSSSG